MARLQDVAAGRIKTMDEAGIDIQVLSHNSPSAQKLGKDNAVALTRRVNDRLAATVAANPTRLAAFAALPTIDPAAAADELERTITEHKFKAAKLDVPIYLHPSVPKPEVIDAYYKEYAAEYPIILRASWGYTVETANQSVRLVLSGVFDAHPNLKFIVGHFGEGVPFLLWRINNGLQRQGAKTLAFQDLYRKHFWVTTSGFFNDAALAHAIAELGLERVLFSVDYPFEAQPPATRWLTNAPLSDEDKAKLASGNAKRLLKL
jgi:2,3-dihydroxybenzoate decarboxylase